MVRATNNPASPTSQYLSMVDGLQSIYANKIKPIEQQFLFDSFHSPLLTNTEIGARPLVLLLGQYSVGKTTFVQHLLGRDYPGANIGPEPTTDRFVAVMYGEDERIIPGNAATVQADLPFTGLGQFGAAFLNKFQVSQSPAALLDSITIVDTPGVLSGDKQRLGRSYDFVKVCEWFAERADLILLLFDAHKLDISDELKSVMHALRPHDDKLRVVLNKADQVSQQQLMRVYGALMWSLGKVVQTPEVPRVYLGSFWMGETECEQSALLESEQGDLLRDLHALPRNAAVRRLNELVKRTRLVRVHAHLLSHLRAQMPTFWGKSSKQNRLTVNIADVFTQIQRQHRLPPGDFPEIDRFQEALRRHDMASFPRLTSKMLAALDEALSIDLPQLMQLVPSSAAPLFQEMAPKRNPFSGDLALSGSPSERSGELSEVEKGEYQRLFHGAHPDAQGRLSGSRCKGLLEESGLPEHDLADIWNLADDDRDGSLTLSEFLIAMRLIKIRLAGGPIPDTLPASLKTLS